MNNMSDDFIQYTGISSSSSDKIENFTQFNVSSKFYIPETKKDIVQINKVKASIEIVESQVVKTPIGKSYEGQILTGNKLFISLDIKVRLEYMCEDETNSIQYIRHTIPVSTDVVIDRDYDDYVSTYPSIIVEDIYCKKLSERKVYMNISLVSIVNIF